jgi:CBS domain-containing protein
MANPSDTTRDNGTPGSSDYSNGLPNGRTTTPATSTTVTATSATTTPTTTGATAGTTAGTTTSNRDFYREALSRSSSRSNYGGGYTGSSYGTSYGSANYGSANYGGTGYGQERYAGRGEADAYEQGHYANTRVPETRGGGRYEEEERHTSRPSGRAMALGAAAMGAAAAGVGLLRRGRWQPEPLTAREVMSAGPKTVRPDQSLREVALLMREENVGIVPVTDAFGRLLGVVTDRDIVVRAVNEDRLPSQVRVQDIMSSDDLECATPDDSVHDVIEMMGKKQVRRVPVVEKDNRLVGIIAMADIAVRAERDEELQAALERISQRRSFWSRLG